MGKGPRLVVKGERHSIYYASCDGGKEPAKEYLEGIANKKPGHRQRFLYVLVRFANGNQVRNSVKKLEGDSELIEIKYQEWNTDCLDITYQVVEQFY